MVHACRSHRFALFLVALLVWGTPLPANQESRGVTRRCLDYVLETANEFAFPYFAVRLAIDTGVDFLSSLRGTSAKPENYSREEIFRKHLARLERTARLERSRYVFGGRE